MLEKRPIALSRCSGRHRFAHEVREGDGDNGCVDGVHQEAEACGHEDQIASHLRISLLLRFALA